MTQPVLVLDRLVLGSRIFPKGELDAKFYQVFWMLALPCVARVAVQLPIYFAGKAAADASPMVAALGVSKVAMGWPLQIAALAGMAWLLGRNRTPVEPEPETA